MRNPRAVRSGPRRRDQLSLPSAFVKSVQWVGCMLAVARDATKTSRAASVIVSMCSTRWVALRVGRRSMASRTKAIPASPMAWVVVGTPRASSAVIASA